MLTVGADLIPHVVQTVKRHSTCFNDELFSAFLRRDPTTVAEDVSSSVLY